MAVTTGYVLVTDSSSQEVKPWWLQTTFKPFNITRNILCVYVCVYAYMCVYVCLHVSMCVHMCICVCVYICVCMYLIP